MARVIWFWIDLLGEQIELIDLNDVCAGLE